MTMRNFAIFAAVVYHILHCFSSASTSQKCGSPVASCPNTREDWKEKSFKYKCVNTLWNYTCIWFSNETLIETCMPNNIIPNGKIGCPYIIGCSGAEPVLAGVNTKCANEAKGCPTKDHKGYSVLSLYKYPACLQGNYSLELPTFSSSTTDLSKLNNETEHGIQDKNDDKNRVWIPIVVALCLAIVGAASIMVLWICLRIKKGRQKKWTKCNVTGPGASDVELQDLVTEPYQENESEIDNMLYEEKLNHMEPYQENESEIDNMLYEEKLNQMEPYQENESEIGNMLYKEKLNQMDDATNRSFQRLVDISKTSMEGFLSNCEYIETRAFQAVMKKLGENRLVLIIGRPGDGKTTLGYQTLTELEFKGFQPLLCRSDDFDKGVCTKRNKLAILFDDVFGLYTLSKQEVGFWRDSRNQNQLRGFLGSGNYAIFVMRKEIYNEANAETISSLFSIESVVDLTDEESYSLTIEEKKKLLKTIPGMTDNTIHLLESITINDEVGFPQCVRLMRECNASEEDSTISLLSTPIQYMRGQINFFNKEMCEKFFILAMAYSNDGSFQSTSIKKKAHNLPKEVQIDPSSYRTIPAIAKSLNGSYLIYQRLEDRYIVSNESIMEALALTIYADLKYIEGYINMSPLRFLQKLDYDCDSEYFLPRHLYSVLFKRLSEMMRFGDKDVFLSSVSVRLFQDPDAARQFSDFLKSENLITKTTSEGLTVLVYAAINGNHILVQHLVKFVSDDDQILFATQKAARYSNLQSVKCLLEWTRKDIELDTLFYAIKGGNPDIFARLLQRIKQEILSSKHKSLQCDILQERIKLSVNLFEEVCLSGQFSLLKELLKQTKSTLSYYVKMYPTLLEYAAYGGCIDLMEYLFENGGLSCPHLIWWAVRSGSIDMVNFLVSKGCRFSEEANISCAFALPSLHLNEMHSACISGNIEVVRYMFPKYESLLHTKDKFGFSPIHACAFSGSVEIVGFLDSMVDITRPTNDGHTLCHFACAEGQTEIMKYMLEHHGELLHQRCAEGKTPFLHAGSSGSVDLVEYLLTQGCDINQRTYDEKNILHIACDQGKIELVKYIIDKYPSVIASKDANGSTPFLYAGSVDLVEYLLTQGCDINQRNDNGKCILHLACAKGKLELVKYLIENDVSFLASRDTNGTTPFLYAGFSESVDLVEYLLTQGCDINDRDDIGTTILHIACHQGKIELVKYIIDKYPSMMASKDTYGSTPFLHAGSVDLVEYLLTQRCDINQRNDNGRGILHIACEKGKIILVKYLIEKHVSLLESKDNNGSKPFLCAGLSGSVDLVEYLLTQGCDINQRTCDGKNILHIACDHGVIQLVKYIIDKYPSVMASKDTYGLTPFLCAGLSGSVDLVQYLLTQGCNINDRNDSGRGILHIACEKGKIILVKYLIEKHVSLLESRDTNGTTPFLCAGLSGSVDLVEYLLTQGCDINDRNDDGRTILYIACHQGKIELVKYIIDKYPSMMASKDTYGSTPFLHAGLFPKYESLLHSKDKFGLSPIHACAFSGSVEIVGFLDSMVDITRPTNDGHTLCHIACQEGQTDIMKYMIEQHGELLHQKCAEGKTPFLHAGSSGSVDLVEYLLTQGCDINDRNDDGRGILHIACEIGKIILVKYLTEKHVPSLPSKDINGTTPFLCAGLSGSIDLVDYLLTQGCDINETDNNGRSILHYAGQGRTRNLVQYIVAKYPGLVELELD